MIRDISFYISEIAGIERQVPQQKQYTSYTYLMSEYKKDLEEIQSVTTMASKVVEVIQQQNKKELDKLVTLDINKLKSIKTKLFSEQQYIRQAAAEAVRTSTF
jgi:predicted DNA-binding ArsR family transcriptional regulator